MEKYNYRENVKNDVMSYIKENIKLSDFEDREEALDKLNEELWTADSVTGNGSGSYTFNTWDAKKIFAITRICLLKRLLNLEMMMYFLKELKRVT